MKTLIASRDRFVKGEYAYTYGDRKWGKDLKESDKPVYGEERKKAEEEEEENTNESVNK